MCHHFIPREYQPESEAEEIKEASDPEEQRSEHSREEREDLVVA